MVYYGQSSEYEVISQLLHSSVNDILICRDRRSAIGTCYLLMVLHDRRSAKLLLEVFESSARGSGSPYVERFAQNDELVYVFPHREGRKYFDFVWGQLTTPAVSEKICLSLVVECLASPLPWPLLYLALRQEQMQLTRDNAVYFLPVLDLSALDPTIGEEACVDCCADILLGTLSGAPGQRKKQSRRRLKSLELIRKKHAKKAYSGFSELYRDIKVTALPLHKETWRSRLHMAWQKNRDGLFRVLLVLCVILTAVALVMLVSQLILGDIPLLRLFRHTFDVIGTKNLHVGGQVR